MLPPSAIEALVTYTSGACAAGGGRLAVLATDATEGEADEYPARYLELSTGAAPTWVTAMIRGAGEPIAVVADLESVLADARVAEPRVRGCLVMHARSVCLSRVAVSRPAVKWIERAL